MANSSYVFNHYNPGAIGIPHKHGPHSWKLCSVQIAHVDESKRLVWLNGGLTRNKYDANSPPSNFMSYHVEPHHPKSGQWVMGDQNIACLTIEQTPLRTTEEDRRIFQESGKILLETRAFLNGVGTSAKPTALQPKQISPWSYKSPDCSYDTYRSAFDDWVDQKEPFWQTLTQEDINKERWEITEFIKSLEQESYEDRNVSGRGILYSCHPGILKSTIISIKMLRQTGCRLPVQVWHMDELQSSHIKVLESLGGVSVHDLTGFVGSSSFNAEVSDTRLYQTKALALLHSTLQKVLFLDGDNLPVQNPSFLFDSQPLRETGLKNNFILGAIFWKDLWKTKPSNPIWKILNLKCVDEFEQESGQIVIDKSFPGVLKALRLSLFIQERSDLFFKLILVLYNY